MPPSPAAATPAAPTGQAEALTDEAEALLLAGRADEAVLRASHACALPDATGRSWRALAQAYEAQGDWTSAYGAYGKALALASEDPAVTGPMARLALRLGHHDDAETLLVVHATLQPPTRDDIADLALARTRRRAFSDAQTTLQAALQADAEAAILWLRLGQLLCAQGRHAEAVVFLEEALRLEPGVSEALDALADAVWIGGGDTDRAIALGEAAVAAASPDAAGGAIEAHARRLLAAGRLDAGWAALAHALDPDVADHDMRVAAPRWSPGEAVEGRLLLVGDDHLAGELMLAAALPGRFATGPALTLALDPRWQVLAQRSFPQAHVVPRLVRRHRGRRQVTAGLESPHVHRGEVIAAWAPLRAAVGGGAAAPAAFLAPDPARVARWREALAGAGPGRKIGVLWRPLTAEGAQVWESPPITELAAALAVPDLTLIALQPDPAPGEDALVRNAFATTLYDPPPLYRRDDIDDLVAMACALDVVVGPAGAATFAAAACGANAWILAPARHWALLGKPAYAWLPTARTFVAPGPHDWTPALADLHRALA